MSRKFKVGDTVRIIYKCTIEGACAIVITKKEFDDYWNGKSGADPLQDGFIPIKIQVGEKEHISSSPSHYIEHFDKRSILIDASIAKHIEENHLDINVILQQTLKIKGKPEEEKIRYIEL